jgi:hypothetical protein
MRCRRLMTRHRQGTDPLNVGGQRAGFAACVPYICTAHCCEGAGSGRLPKAPHDWQYGGWRAQAGQGRMRCGQSGAHAGFVSDECFRWVSDEGWKRAWGRSLA